MGSKKGLRKTKNKRVLTELYSKDKTEKIFEPSYIELHRRGELAERIRKAYLRLEECDLCPRNCGVNRLVGEKGVCQVEETPLVSSYGPHFGEERPLVGSRGSGTIFLTFCSLKCIFCQNYQISHLGEGDKVTIEEVAGMMVYLQRIGCHNINFVTPTHFVPQILKALSIAINQGLNIPLVYNCGGYEKVETLQLLDKVFDIYMPDFKYASEERAREFSRAQDYPEVAKAALKEMHRQVGDLVIDERGIALRGFLVRHLVLPEGLAGTKEAMQFIAKKISPNTYINIMNQYHPCYHAFDYPPLNRRLSLTEFEEAINATLEEGLWRLDT